MRPGRLRTLRLLARMREQLERHPDDADSYVGLAMAFERAGKRLHALECYQRALELAPGDEAILERIRALPEAEAAPPRWRPRPRLRLRRPPTR